MDKNPRSRRTVTERMREQLALKGARARARELGIPLEAYLGQLEQDARLKGEAKSLEKMSDRLAARIADRLKGSLAPSPVSDEPRIAFDDLQGIVDHLLKK